MRFVWTCPVIRDSLLLLCIATVGVAQEANSAAGAWTQANKSDALHGTLFREFALQGKFLVPPQHSSVPAPVLILHPARSTWFRER